MAKQRLVFDFLKTSSDIREGEITEEERRQYEQVIPIPYEPKRNNRFRITLPEIFELEPWLIKSASRPKISLNETGYDVKPFWIKFNDPIGPSTTQKLWEISLGLTQDVEYLEDIRENGFEMVLEMLDPVGTVVERWVMSGVRILDMDFGDLDYTVDELSECGMRVKPENISLIF